MSDSVDSPEDATPTKGSEERKAQQAKRMEGLRLRMNLKFVEGEIERHQQSRKELKASLEALGGPRAKKSK